MINIKGIVAEQFGLTEVELTAIQNVSELYPDEDIQTVEELDMIDILGAIEDEAGVECSDKEFEAFRKITSMPELLQTLDNKYNKALEN